MVVVSSSKNPLWKVNVSCISICLFLLLILSSSSSSSSSSLIKFSFQKNNLLKNNNQNIIHSQNPQQQQHHYQQQQQQQHQQEAFLIYPKQSPRYKRKHNPQTNQKQKQQQQQIYKLYYSNIPQVLHSSDNDNNLYSSSSFIFSKKNNILLTTTTTTTTTATTTRGKRRTMKQDTTTTLAASPKMDETFNNNDTAPSSSSSSSAAKSTTTTTTTDSSSSKNVQNNNPKNNYLSKEKEETVVVVQEAEAEEEEEEETLKNIILSGSWWDDTINAATEAATNAKAENNNNNDDDDDDSSSKEKEKTTTILGKFGNSKNYKVEIIDETTTTTTRTVEQQQQQQQQQQQNKIDFESFIPFASQNNKENGKDSSSSGGGDDDDDYDETKGNVGYLEKEARELDEAVTILSGTDRNACLKDVEIVPLSTPTTTAATATTTTTTTRDDFSTSTSTLFQQQDYNEDDDDEGDKDKEEEKEPFWKRKVTSLKEKKKALAKKSIRKTLSLERQRQKKVVKKRRAALPLSDPEHYSDRIGRDMRHLSLSIASSVDSAWQWQLFCDEGGGILPLLQCIREGAKSVEEGGEDFFLLADYGEDDEIMTKFIERHEESFAAACSACRSLRDLCALSDEFAAVVTDDILRADALWSVDVRSEDGSGEDCSSGGLISHLVTLLKHANEAEKMYSGGKRSRKKSGDVVARSGGVRWGNRRSRREARRRCGLYVVQLLLAMAVTSDAAINRFRGTSGFVDVVRACSSYAPKERRRRWFRYPMEVIKKRITKRPNVLNRADIKRPFIAATAVGDGLDGAIMSTANQLLAAIGYNVWVPKIPGQKGLRILCLDGGGTRGIAAITTLSCIVDAMGGMEVCDAFDVIAGTSTGAIIAFLVGLRRESSEKAKKRYDALIKRIFVKSALSAPMLVFTTATYDEAPFLQVMKEILGDNSMLDSRADPAVPLVFAVSSKMSSNPTELCLFRNYNYSGGEQADTFVIDPDQARVNLGLKPADNLASEIPNEGRRKILSGACVPRNREASRHPGSFRVLQKVALRCSTAAPTVFKPVRMGGELFCDGGIVASNPTAVAVHEARMLFPDVPIEMIVSCGTGGFQMEKAQSPSIGWQSIIGQIVSSATDAESVHHILDDILGEGGTTQVGRSSVSKTRYFRLNPIVGTAEDFPIDATDPKLLEELSQITRNHLQEEEQARKLEEIGDILDGRSGWRKFVSRLTS